MVHEDKRNESALTPERKAFWSDIISEQADDGSLYIYNMNNKDTWIRGRTIPIRR